MLQQKHHDIAANNLPVFDVYDCIDKRVVNGGGLCYDCRDSLGVW